MLRLVVLISGGGSNLRALLEASQDAEFPARVVAIGADRDADGLAHAEEFGIPTFVVPFGAYADARGVGRRAARTDRAVGGGPRRPVRLHAAAAAAVVDALTPRLLNTHPAFLPEFPGAHAVRDALAAGATETGASVIVVDHGVDSGPVVAQRRVPVLPGDTEARLHDRIKLVERELLVQVVLDIANGRPRPRRNSHERAPRRNPDYRERDVIPIRRALISVYDKTGLLELAATARRSRASRSSRPDRRRS